jgi:putative membrane protein
VGDEKRLHSHESGTSRETTTDSQKENTMNTLMTIAAHDPGYYNGPGGWWPIFPIFWLLFFIGIVAFIATRRRRWSDCGPSSTGRSRLSERFAAGEIDEDEYRSRLAVLDENRRGGRR